MSQPAYDVEVIVQEQNPICWVASCAMVKGFGTKTSTGVADFTGGFDLSNSRIANLASNWTQCTDMMNGWGLNISSVGGVASGSMTGDALAGLLQANGPAVLLHLCNGFPCDPKWTPLTSGANAVVITRVDSDAGTATFNNLWGDKDQPIDLTVLLGKVNADQSIGKTLGFWRS